MKAPLAITLCAGLIRLYQRYVSPYKGFRCAHAAYHGGPSCSEAVHALILEHGLLAGLPSIKTRFHECRLAYQALQSEEKTRKKKRRRYHTDRDRRCDYLDFRECPFDIDLPCDIGPCDCSSAFLGVSQDADGKRLERLMK